MCGIIQTPYDKHNLFFIFYFFRVLSPFDLNVHVAIPIRPNVYENLFILFPFFFFFFFFFLSIFLSFCFRLVSLHFHSLTASQHTPSLNQSYLIDCSMNVLVNVSYGMNMCQQNEKKNYEENRFFLYVWDFLVCNC